MTRALTFFLSLFFISSMNAAAQEPQVQAVPEVEQIAAPVAPVDAAMTFALVNSGDCKECVWIAAEGRIASETLTTFEDFIGKNPELSTRRILLHSNGGDLLAAMALGRLFREKGFSTIVARTVKTDEKEKPQFSNEAGSCIDACLWAYLGGRSRGINKGSVIQLKTYRPPLDEAGAVSGMEVATRKQQLADIAYIDDYADRMGFNRSVSFVDWQNADPHRFTDDELVSLGILFNPDVFSSWAIKPQANGLVVKTASRDKKRIARFYCDTQNRRYFELTVPGEINADALDELNKTQTFVSVLGKKIRLKKMLFSSKQGTTTLNIRLINFNPATLKDNQFTFSMENAPKVLNGFSNIELENLPAFKTLSKFVLRSCVSAAR